MGGVTSGWYCDALDADCETRAAYMQMVARIGQVNNARILGVPTRTTNASYDALLDEAGLLTAMAYESQSHSRQHRRPAYENSEFTSSMHSRVGRALSSESSHGGGRQSASTGAVRCFDSQMNRDRRLPFGRSGIASLL